MQILTISQSFPYPPNDGNVGPIWHFTRHLAPHARQTMLTIRPDDPARWTEGARLIREWGVELRDAPPFTAGRAARAAACLRHRRPWLNRFFNPAFLDLCHTALAEREWDVVQVWGILSAQHLPLRPIPRSLLLERDCRSLAHFRAWERTRNPYERFQAAKLGWMERSLYPLYRSIIAVSPVDLEAMRRISDRPRYHLLPTGVDEEAFIPAPEREEPATVLFTGVMDFAPNTEAALFAAREIWPRVRARRPAARLLLVGRDPTPALRALGASDIIVTGAVPRIEDFTAAATVVIAPIFQGSGIKNKVMEGAFMQKAIVATPLALEGLPLTPGVHCEVAATADAFADAIVALLADPARRAALGRAARAAVEQEFSMKRLALKLIPIHESLAAEPWQ